MSAGIGDREATAGFLLLFFVSFLHLHLLHSLARSWLPGGAVQNSGKTWPNARWRSRCQSGHDGEARLSLMF